MIRGLEVEKAYLFGRLSWEGRKEAFRLHQENGKITLKDLRLLMRDYTYDPSAKWKEDWKPSNSSKRFAADDLLVEPKTPVSQKAYHLVTSLQGIVDELLDIRHQWEGDPRIIELVGAKELNGLSMALCAGRHQDLYEF